MYYLQDLFNESMIKTHFIIITYTLEEYILLFV
jgi:hypothetical protein